LEQKKKEKKKERVKKGRKEACGTSSYLVEFGALKMAHSEILIDYGV
jgi:hypothetical protein